MTNEEINSSYKVVFQYLIYNYYAFIAINIMLIVISITLFVFICYHLNLIKLILLIVKEINKLKLLDI